MLAVFANTRNRVTIADLSEVVFGGNPATVSVTRLSDGETVELTVGERFPATVCPDFFTIKWEIDGLLVSAQLDLASSQYCTLDDIRSYRAGTYELGAETDDTIASARAHATEVIERECERYFTPVLREALIERTNCTAAKVPIVEGGIGHDITSVVRGTYINSGNTAPVTLSSSVSVNVSACKVHEPICGVLQLGVGYIPSEIKDAVIALAAWYLVPKAAPDNATSTSTDAGVLRFVVGGVGDAETSLPEVNAAIKRWGTKAVYVR